MCTCEHAFVPLIIINSGETQMLTSKATLPTSVIYCLLYFLKFKQLNFVSVYSENRLQSLSRVNLSVGTSAETNIKGF